MRLWWVSMSLVMELAGEEGKVITSCSTGIPHWEMRLERSAGSVVASRTSSTSSSSYRWRKCSQCQSGLTGSQGDPPVPGMLYPSLVRLLLLFCSLAKAVSDVNDAMML